MLQKMVELLGEVCPVIRRLLRRGLGLQTSRHVNVFFVAKGWILFEQVTYVPVLMSQHNGMDSIKIKGTLCTVINNYVTVLKT
jgi:hypothetical protein